MLHIYIYDISHLRVNFLLRSLFFFLIFGARTVDIMITLGLIFLNQNRRHHRDFYLYCVRFQFLISVCVKNTIFRDVTLCNVLEIQRRFARESYCHLQVGRMFVRKGATSRKSSLLYYFSATYSSKTTTTTTTTTT